MFRGKISLEFTTVGTTATFAIAHELLIGYTGDDITRDIR